MWLCRRTPRDMPHTVMPHTSLFPSTELSASVSDAVHAVQMAMAAMGSSMKISQNTCDIAWNRCRIGVAFAPLIELVWTITAFCFMHHKPGHVHLHLHPHVHVHVHPPCHACCPGLCATSPLSSPLRTSSGTAQLMARAMTQGPLHTQHLTTWLRCEPALATYPDSLQATHSCPCACAVESPLSAALPHRTSVPVHTSLAGTALLCLAT